MSIKPSPFGFNKFVAKENQVEFEQDEAQILTNIELKVKHHQPIQLHYGFQKSLSYSQYSTWAKCPHQWKLTYIDKLRPFKDNIHVVFGTAIHETIQHYLTIMFEKSEAEADTTINLKEYFKDKFANEYKTRYKKAGEHFTTPEAMNEFYEDGCEILDFFQKNRSKYFSKDRHRLVGIEVPLQADVIENVFYGGFMDLVLYDIKEDKIIIYDLKTSNKGWDKEKTDNLKLAQILLYKHYFSKQFDYPIEKIRVEFFIFKRKIFQYKDFPNPRIQQFEPANGKSKVNDAVSRIAEFVRNCFDGKGKHLDREHPKVVGKDSCEYCPFYKKPELCDRNKKKKDD